MRNWKRSLIWILTFLFGLYYIVDFLLPEEFGGAFDRSGLGSATAVYSSQWWVYYSALAGPMKADGSRPDEKLQLYRITRFPLDDPSKRDVVLAPSPLRREDYHGAKSPSVVLSDGRWQIWYVGLSFVDRFPAIMRAESEDGVTWTGSRAVIDDPLRLAARRKELEAARKERVSAIRGDASMPEQAREEAVRQATAQFVELVKRLQRHWLAKGIQAACVRRDGPGYRMWFVGEGTGTTAIGRGSSRDGLTWVLEKEPLPMDRQFARITSVTASREGGEWAVMFVADGKLLRWREGKVMPARLPSAAATREYVSADVVSGAGATLLLASYFDNGRQSLAVYQRRGAGWAALGEPVGPGRRGVRIVPIPLSTMAGWILIVSAFAVGIGLIGLLQIHLRRMVRFQPGWHDSILLIVSMIAICAALVMYRSLPAADAARQVTPEYRTFVERAHDLLWMRMQVPLGATMFSLLAAFLVSAAYRAFRIRGRDATILAISATLVMLAQVPVGDFLTSWMPPAWEESFGMASVRQWYLNLANSAVQRGISFGVFVGSIAMALRIWLSLDRFGPER
jgi:hypothetical protein